MDQLSDTIEFNKNLALVRNQMLGYTARLNELKTESRPPLPTYKPGPNWTSEFIGIHASYSYDYFPKKRGRKPKEVDLAENLNKNGEITFTCKSCKRVLEIKKKYAKEQCQTCYKKNKKNDQDQKFVYS
ncbi:unnamed protein product [Blepharisma stoltei]|uniref:Uncharacterized protein n=1 Tax=Blepharisma stoltei TaxID=1481888 RepID=A0AAU9JHN9_9CILI|nr:unnamed protein product [Blepharisma stoltei]